MLRLPVLQTLRQLFQMAAEDLPVRWGQIPLLYIGRGCAGNAGRDYRPHASAERCCLMFGRHFSVILLPINKCNVACDYCFEDKTDDLMSIAMLDQIIEKL